MVYSYQVQSDIERLEAEIHRSRVEPWDVETFLADRHRAHIETLTSPENKTASRIQVVKEMSDLVFIFIGRVATILMLTIWFLNGSIY